MFDCRTVDEKWRLVCEFNAAQKMANPDDLVKLLRRTVKKPRYTGQLGFFGCLCGKEPEWIIEFVRCGGVKQLLKLSAHLSCESAEDFLLLGAVCRSLKEVVSTDEGMEAILEQERHLPSVFLALDLCDERVQIELLQSMAAVALRSTVGCVAVVRGLLEKKLLPTQQQTLGRSTMTRRRATTADSASVTATVTARNLSWTGLDRLTNLLVGGGCSDDLLLACVMCIHALLLRVPPELRDRLKEAFQQVRLRQF